VVLGVVCHISRMHSVLIAAPLRIEVVKPPTHVNQLRLCVRFWFTLPSEQCPCSLRLDLLSGEVSLGPFFRLSGVCMVKVSLSTPKSHGDRLGNRVRFRCAYPCSHGIGLTYRGQYDTCWLGRNFQGIPKPDLWSKYSSQIVRGSPCKPRVRRYAIYCATE